MLLKYLGTSDIRKIPKGSNIGGRYNGEVPVDIVWNWANNHVVDTESEEYKDIDSAVWEVILEAEGEGIVDVTDVKKMPISKGEAMWKGVKTYRQKKDNSDSEPEPTAHTKEM